MLHTTSCGWPALPDPAGVMPLASFKPALPLMLVSPVGEAFDVVRVDHAAAACAGSANSARMVAGSSKPLAMRSASAGLPMALPNSMTACSGGGNTIMLDHCTDASTRL